MNRTKKVVALATTGAVLAVSGTAFALWSATGTGSGAAKARTAAPISVTAVTGAADLFPGSTGALSFTLTNTNPYAVSFTSLTPGVVTSSNPTGCPAANLTTNALTGLTGLSVAPNATSGTLTVPGAVNMVTAAGDGCQGVTFTVAVSLTGSQV